MTATESTNCGTSAGYQSHKRAAEPACEPCRSARNAYLRAWRRGEKPQVRQPRREAQCGTRSGYERHRRRKEQPCEPCRAARKVSARKHQDATRHYIAARGRALSRLADAHPQQMAELLAAELAEGDTVVRQPWKWKAA